MQHIKGMEKFFLGTFFSYYKLDIIDHEYINGTVLVPQLGHGGGITASDRFNYFISKGFGSNINHLHIRILFQDKMADGMHKVGFTQSGTTIYIEGIISVPRWFRYCKTGGMGEFVIASDYEGIKFVLRIQVSIFIINIKGTAVGGFQIFWRRLVLLSVLFQYKGDFIVMIHHFCDGHAEEVFIFGRNIIKGMWLVGCDEDDNHIILDIKKLQWLYPRVIGNIGEIIFLSDCFLNLIPSGFDCLHC